MKIFRDFSQPFQRTCESRLGIVSRGFLVAFVFFCGSFAVSPSTASENLNSIISSLSNSTSSPAVISTNFASLKNNTFRTSHSKKHGKYASFKTSTSVYTTTGATSATTKVPSLPTATTETTTTEGPPPPGPIVSVNNFTTPVSVGNLTSEEIPDQIASGSDHEFVRISAPHHSIVAPDPDFVNTFTHVGSQQNDVEASELSHHEGHLGHGGFAPPTSSNFPQSFEKFGVQDTLRYKNEFAGVGGGVAGVAQSSGPSSTHSGEQHTPEFQTGFTITPQPPHLATTFQHSGGFSRSQGARSLGAPAQPTSGGAYQFSGGGLHEISPYGGSPSPPIQTVSPYNSPSHNNNNGAHQTHFAQHPPSTPPNFGALNNVQNNFAAAVPPSTGFHPANTNYDSWQPTGNVQPEAVFPGGAQRRSDPVSNLIKHKARQSHALNLEQEPQSSRTPSFGPPQSNSQEGSNEGFLGSFKTGDMPQELQNPDKKQNSGNRQQQMTSGSEEHFKGSPPDNSESLQQGSGGFNGFGPGGGPPAESNESQNFGGPPRGNSPPASHDSQLFGEPSAESHESQNFNAPPRSNYNTSPEPHSNHPQPFPDEDFPSKPHPQRSPNLNVGFAPSSNSQGFGDFGGFQGGNIPAPAKFQAAPEQPKFPNHPFHSPPSPGASVTFHGYDENELSDAPQQQQQSAPEAPHQNQFPQPNWPNHDTPKHSNQQHQHAQDPHHHPQSFGGFPGNNIQEPQAHHQHAAAPAHEPFGGFPGGNQGQQHQPHYNSNFADFNGDSHPHQSPQHQSAPQDFHNFGPSQKQAGAPQGFNNFGPPQQQQGGAPQGFNNFQPPQQESLPVRGFANFRLPKPDAPGGSQGFAKFEQPQGKPDAPQSLNYFQPPQPLQAPPPRGFNQFQTPSHSGSDESKSSSNEPDQAQPQNFGGFSGEPEETPNPQGPPPHENFGGFSSEQSPATPQQHRPQHQTSATPGFGGFPGDNAPQHQPEGNGFQGFGKFPGGNAGLALKPAAAPPHSKFSSFQGSERDLGPYPPEGPLLDGFQDTESSSSDEHPVSVEQNPPPGFEAQGFNAFQHENSPFQGLSQNQQQNQHQNQPQHHYNNKQQPLFQQHHAHTPNYHNNQPIPRSEETPDIGQPHPPQQLYPSPGQIQNVGNEPQHHPQQGGGLGPSFHNAPNHPHQHHPNVEQFQNVQHPPYAPPHLQQTMTNPIQTFGQNYPNQQHHPAGGAEGQNFGNNFPINQHNLVGSLNDASNIGHHFPIQQQHHPGGSVEEGPNDAQQFPEQHHHEGSVEENPNIGFNHNPTNPQQHHGTGEPQNFSPGGGGSVEFDQGNQGIANGPINNFNGGGAGAGLSGAFAGGIGPGPISNGQNQGISQAPFGGGPDGSGSIENGDGGGGHNEIGHYQSHGPENQGYFNGGGGGGGGNPGLGVGLLKDDKKHGLTIKQKLKYPIVKVIKTLIELGHKILSFYAKFAIPKEHYLRVISFIGVYLLFAWLYKDNEHLLQPKCEAWGWNGPEEFTFHAPARFVPAVPVDQHMQREFLDLFRGVENCLDEKVEKDKKKKKKKDKKRKKNKDKSSSSSEEDDISAEADYSTEIGFINDMCPKGQFFYSMSPYHIEAWQTLSRMFVAQKSPADVLHLAKSLLYSHSVNPKVWYLGLMAAAQERPDMTGFALAHPIDAIPDLFVPGHLIETELDRYRGIGVTRKKRAAFKLNSTSFADNTFEELLNGTLFLETGQAVPLFNETKKGQSRILRRNGESSEEDDEADDDDDDDDDNRGTAQHKKKHPLGYGYGSVGDAYGGIGNSNRLKNKDKHKGDGGDDNDNDKDDKNKKGKGHGKKGHKKKGKGKKKDKKKCIIVDGSVGLDNGIENKLWYWREDMMLNQHHAYWHQVYALNATMHGDRRAEIFFFMHRNFLSRYNAERLSNGFARTVELGLYPGAPIVEGYDAHIKDFNSGQWWTPRAPETPLTDILHIHDPDFARDIIINDVLGLYNKFVKAIKWGKLITAEGKFLPIRFHEGLQPLANTVEASNLSVNPFYYDAFGLHNLGHLMVALAADPDFTKGLPTGIMAEAAVSMRDPSFYTYHAIIDNLFEKFKQTLVPYKSHGGVWPLEWHGVDIVDVKLVSHGSESHNQLTTFYIKHKYQLEPGVDRSVAKGIEKAEICAVHLDHAAFQFQIMIDRKKCAKSKSGQGTVRIFMAPRYNEHGDRLPLAEQRRLMFILDTFQADLKVGRNIITRNSRDNSLTKPWSRSLKDYERGPDPSGAADYCGCGFPTHLFIPKGKTKGMAFDLFVMVTNFDEDYVPNHPIDMEIPETCNSPYIFCGHPRRRYPDARPMGYPWDRPPTHVPLKKCGKGLTLKDLLCKITGKFVARPAATLEEYVSIASNMAMTVFEIKHIPKVVGKHYG